MVDNITLNINTKPAAKKKQQVSWSSASEIIDFIQSFVFFFRMDLRSKNVLQLRRYLTSSSTWTSPKSRRLF